MKKTLFLATLILFASCNDNGGSDQPINEEPTESYIDASASDMWHYFSLKTGQVVGSAKESDENNAAWGARADWDIAIQRYKIRTNSGDFTTAGAKGGVYTPDGGNLDEFGNILVTTTFDSVDNVPTGVEFETDKPIEEEAMSMPGVGGAFTTVVRSEAVVVQMWKNATGWVMPPDYRPAPVYIFRTADGENFYKVEFTEYKNTGNVAGHVKFQSAQIYE
jgi:hypothetical protein